MSPSPENDISPYYKFLGLLGLVGAFAFVFLRESWSWVDFCVLAALILTVLALIRPRLFDHVVKRIATWLPFTKYGSGKDA